MTRTGHAPDEEWSSAPHPHRNGDTLTGVYSPMEPPDTSRHRLMAAALEVARGGTIGRKRAMTQQGLGSAKDSLFGVFVILVYIFPKSCFRLMWVACVCPWEFVISRMGPAFPTGGGSYASRTSAVPRSPAVAPGIHRLCLSRGGSRPPTAWQSVR